MATVTGLTAARMQAMEDATIISGTVTGGNLILTKKGGGTVNAGPVIGPTGPAGGAFIICTSTTRPTLTAGEEGKGIWETDTNLVRMWDGVRWRLQEKIICTSVTRPAMTAGDEGVKIYETDTNLEFIWSGTAWILASTYSSFATATERGLVVPSPSEGMMSYIRDVDTLEIYNGTAWRKPWNLPWGIVGKVNSTTAYASSTGSPADVSDLTLTVPFISGRCYKFSIQGHLYSNDYDDIGRWSITTDANIAIGFPNTFDYNITQENMPSFCHSTSYEDAGTSGNAVRKVRLTRPTGHGNTRWLSDATRRSLFMVEDIGPAA